MKQLLVALLIGGVALSAVAGQVNATEVNQDQKLKQELKIECETGAYGQSSKCKAYGEQKAEQSQKVVVRDRVLGKTHDVVDTALDTQTAAAVTGVLATGVGSIVLKRKLS